MPAVLTEPRDRPSEPGGACEVECTSAVAAESPGHSILCRGHRFDLARSNEQDAPRGSGHRCGFSGRVAWPLGSCGLPGIRPLAWPIRKKQRFSVLQRFGSGR